jgi:CDP-diglyceride synthetase
MSKAVKAALLSGLVFPGLGHFSLKKTVQGFIFSCLSALCFYFLFSSIYDIAQQVSLQIQQGEIAMDILSINSALTQQVQQNQPKTMSYATWAILALWIVAIIDSYRIGAQQDKELNDD